MKPQSPVASLPFALVLAMLAALGPFGNPVWGDSAQSPSAACIQALKLLPGPSDSALVQKLCMRAKILPSCTSVRGKPIFSVDSSLDASDASIASPTAAGKVPVVPKTARKILVFALIHGDEAPSGSVARSWMERLETFAPRNQWRIVPILNPDGLEKKTRINANGVDLNRNFPTADWILEAEKHWREKAKADIRRFPGKTAASEPETRCAVDHIADFAPDFIVSIHTPYGLLDFDGSRTHLPRSKLLPWRFLGHYPGSLGRFMWFDHHTPVMTVELKETGVIEALESFDSLQDLAGEIALHQHPENLTPKPTPTLKQ